MNPHKVTADFEAALCEYTGARYAVATNSCTNALLIALSWFRPKYFHTNTTIWLPRFTYVGVAQSVCNAGFRVRFRPETWRGEYRLEPLPLWDAARRFTSGMFRRGNMQCVSFHISKILGIDQGGAVLHDDPDADVWLRKARFDGRSEGVHPKDDVFTPGYHCYMSPNVAAQGLWRLSFLPRHNEDLPNSDYPDLSRSPLFGYSGERSASISRRIA